MYQSNSNTRWPSKIPGTRWKLFDDNKRGGMLVKAGWEQVDKDIQGNESKKWQGIEIKTFGNHPVISRNRILVSFFRISRKNNRQYI